MNARKRLIVNADDFGLTRDVNEGILESHKTGIVSSTTLMANGEAFEHAASLALGCPSLGVGCHLVLVGGASLLPPYRLFPASVGSLLRTLLAGGLSIREELEAQLSRVLAAGIPVTHLDTHKHAHVLPPVLEAVSSVAQQFGIPWIRRPFDSPRHTANPPVPWRHRTLHRALGLLQGRFDRILENHQLRATDHFCGFQLTGRFGTKELGSLIRSLPAGSTEFMCHPGRLNEDLRGAHTRLKESRERELEALVAPETRAVLQECGVDLISYRDL